VCAYPSGVGPAKFSERELIDLSALGLPLWVGFLSSFGFGILVVLTIRWHGVFSLDEAVGVQKVHAHPTPRIGGLPMVLGLLAAIWASPLDLQQKLWPWIIAGVPAFAFGFAEDLTKSISVMSRLLATMASGVLAWCITGYSLTGVDVWGLDWLLQFTIVSVLFTAFAVGGIANAINIIDGLNGLASSMVLWALLGVAALAGTLGDAVLASSCLLLSACVLGFFLVNWPFGKLFLGDGGSYFLGFSLAWACVLLIERHSIVSAFAALLICIHPITEVLYSVYRRMLRKQNLGQPDRLHFHSLVKRRIMPRLLPQSGKTMRNSVGGVLVGCMTILPATVMQFTYASTGICLLAVFVLVLGYLWLFRRIVAKFGS
jgi:UDP-N-acetylmuramyl pentapeptide phosphotransferase/UDP-N-acetylglucosamine-1-phosphate transferase